MAAHPFRSIVSGLACSLVFAASAPLGAAESEHRADSASAAEAKKSPQHRSAPSGIAHYDVFADGRTLHLLVGERRDADVVLSHRRSTDAGRTWSTPVRIDRDGDSVFAPHPGEHPQVAAIGERVVVLWTQRNPETGRGGSIALAHSSDAGRTWNRGVTPAGDDSQAYHGLLEIASDGRAFHAVWLRPAAADATPAQGLHYARSNDGISWTAQQAVDTDTCRCCWNRVVATDDGVGVLFRDGTPRDMAYAALVDGAWRKPVAAGRFDWAFEGCPHVGGALAHDGDALHALVWTGVDDARAGLWHLTSNDDGARWSEPVRFGDADARESDLAAAGGKLVALWSVVGDGGSRIRRAESGDGGATWSEAVTLSTDARIALQPRVVAAGTTPVAFWLEKSESGANVLRIDGRVFSGGGAAATAP